MRTNGHIRADILDDGIYINILGVCECSSEVIQITGERSGSGADSFNSEDKKVKSGNR
ncbi:MAG: hypothetical protein ACTSRP_27695 [Candidatus Helarchaeota archaeon]